MVKRRENQPSSDPASPLFDEREPSSGSSMAPPTPSPETPTSSAAIEDELSPSSASALEDARRRYRQLVSRSGDAREPSLGSSAAQGKQSSGSSVTPLHNWSPIPRYLVAELERMGASREQAVKVVVVAYWAAGEEVTR